MSAYVPLSKSKHAGFGWKQPLHYTFTANTDMVAILAEEIDKVMPVLPLAFRGQKEPSGKNSYELVALLSPIANRNLFLKSDGSWLSGHVPVQFRGYPFRMMTVADNGEQVVCFDQDSGLLTESGSTETQTFFNDDGEPSPEFTRYLEFLQQYEQRRTLTQTAVDTLAELDLLVPWNLVVKDGDKQKKMRSGIFKVNPEALQQLAAEPLYKLNQCGALSIAYGQLLSEQRTQNFGELLRIQRDFKEEGSKTASLEEIASLFGSNSDMLNFDKF